MANFIRVNLIIFEEDTPWLYQALAAINPKRRARYMREKLLLSHSLGTQLTATNKSLPAKSYIERLSETPLGGVSGNVTSTDGKYERAAASVLELLDETNEQDGLCPGGLG